ncbi:hypothetical protein KL86PLE_90149 [uncultured Pleomorphomonas sp.]|uniref:Uncharacterized protein n=1 Tax=uncultured Pleomorphomonas sp. TaxID=442121 RepID=A0A212LN28_9HYPH|nr:hypothetical protein KL86PLE_90149 [uncultured Pleomorphomonas sp.]
MMISGPFGCASLPVNLARQSFKFEEG